jgi:N-acetylglucosaminyl-diphospho-decaprenol L-rhamnosyltransferase
MVSAPGTACLLAPALSTRLTPWVRRQSRPRLQTPRLSVVVVNYFQWENTAALIRQLSGAPCTHRGAAEVVVVDNHSPAHRLAGRLRRWPGVSLRRWGRNRGFARAVNEGCRLSRGEWCLLLNPDMTLPDGFLPGVLALAQELTATEPRAGIVGFQLRNTDGTRQLSAGFFPSLLGTLAGLFQPRSQRKYVPLDVPQRCRVPWVTGCCLLVRRACLEDLGGFDEDYFLYYEDVDLCRRARARDWSVWYEPRLRAVHHHPLHSRPVPPLLRLITRHSLLTYSSRHWQTWQARLLAGIVQLEARARQLRAWCRGDAEAVNLFAEMRALARDMARGRHKLAWRRLKQAVRRHELSPQMLPINSVS